MSGQVALAELIMVPLSVCPEQSSLREYLVGLLDGAEADSVERHLLTCAACQTTSHQVPLADPLTDALAGQPTIAGWLDDPNLEPLIHRLRSQVATQLGPRDSGPDVDLTRLGSYRILRLLGRGGMGLVYEAQDDTLDRRVALKVMAADLAADPTARERFLREARAAAALQDDHVVAIFQVGEAAHGGRPIPYLVMPLLRGETLEALSRRTPVLAAAEVVRIGKETAMGLAAAHAAGLVHRDVKPANLWLEEGTGRVKILDFGLARLQTESQGLTERGVVVGTPAFAAPEQAGGGMVDARSDLFSLGCVLYQVATGTPPFPGRTLQETVTAIARGMLQPPHRINPAVPRSLSGVITRLLAPDPAHRPASAVEVVRLLDQVERNPRSSRNRRVGLAALLLGFGAVAATVLVLENVFYGQGGWPTQSADTPPTLVTTTPKTTPDALVPPPGEDEKYRVTIGSLEVKPTNPNGQPWDDASPLDGPLPDLAVKLTRVDPALVARVEQLEKEKSAVVLRDLRSRNIATREAQLAAMAPDDPKRPAAEKLLAGMKSGHVPLTADDRQRLANLDPEIKAVRARFEFVTATVNDALQADFNAASLSVAPGDVLVAEVLDRDYLRTEIVGITRVTIRPELLDGQAVVEPRDFNQVKVLRLHFTRQP